MTPNILVSYRYRFGSGKTILQVTLDRKLIPCLHFERVSVANGESVFRTEEGIQSWKYSLPQYTDLESIRINTTRIPRV